MLHFLIAKPGARRVLGTYLEEWGERIRDRVAVRSYDEVDVSRIERGTVVFCDLDVLTPERAARAAQLWEALGARGIARMNRPGAALGRYELLRRLHERGDNSFNVFRVAELDASLRFPVFIRREADHRGALSPLLHDRAALDCAIAAAVADGVARDALLVVEFADTAVDGIYRKYSAVKIGRRIIAHHVFTSRDWEAKIASHLTPTLDSIVEESEFQLANPHQAAVAEAFRVAAIDYGRIDYGIRNGRIEVWEINMMPTLLRPKRFYQPAQMHAKRWFANTLNEKFLRLSRARPRPPRDAGGRA